MSSRYSRGSAAGNIITLLLLVGMVALGAWLWLGRKDEPKRRRAGAEQRRTPDKGDERRREARWRRARRPSSP